MNPHSIFHKAGYASFRIAVVDIGERIFSPEVNDGLVKPMEDSVDSKVQYKRLFKQLG